MTEIESGQELDNSKTLANKRSELRAELEVEADRLDFPPYLRFRPEETADLTRIIKYASNRVASVDADKGIAVVADSRGIWHPLLQRNDRVLGVIRTLAASTRLRAIEEIKRRMSIDYDEDVIQDYIRQISREPTANYIRQLAERVRQVMTGGEGEYQVGTHITPETIQLTDVPLDMFNRRSEVPTGVILPIIGKYAGIDLASHQYIDADAVRDSQLMGVAWKIPQDDKEELESDSVEVMNWFIHKQVGVQMFDRIASKLCGVCLLYTSPSPRD